DAAENHMLALAGERRDGKTVAQRLAETGEVGLHRIMGLRTAARPAQAGDHLVQNEQRAVAMAKILEAPEVARIGLVAARGLQDERRDRAGMAGEKRPRIIEV